MSACVLQLGLDVIGQVTGKRAVYDASWSENDQLADWEISPILEIKRAEGHLKF